MKNSENNPLKCSHYTNYTRFENKETYKKIFLLLCFKNV